MSRIYISILALALWATFAATAFASDAGGSAFDAANRLYDQGKFAEAASAYEKVLQSGSVSPALYFNFGNALFKSGEIGKAVAAYRKAGELAPRDPDVRANLQFVRNQIQGPSLQPGRIQNWLRRLTVNEWTALTSVAFWLCLILAAIGQFRPSLKRTLRGALMSSGLATVAFGICLASAIHAGSVPTAIVTVPNAAARIGPIEESPTAFTARNGAELNLLDTKDAWVQVSVGNRIGWLKREQVVFLSGY